MRVKTANTIRLYYFKNKLDLTHPLRGSRASERFPDPILRTHVLVGFFLSWSDSPEKNLFSRTRAVRIVEPRVGKKAINFHVIPRQLVWYSVITNA